jgi:hypothetical protein
MTGPFRRPPLILILVLQAAGGSRQLRGGKKKKRDKWFGFENKPDFEDFRRWWHRVGKFEADGMDLNSRKAVEDVYNDWVVRGRPKVK